MLRFAFRFLKIAAPAVAILAGLGVEAQADLITTLYDTGTTSSTTSGSTFAAGGSTSTKYTLTGPYSTAIVAGSIPSVYATASDALWIGPGSDLNQNYAGGTYTYTTTFSLGAFAPTTAAISGKVAADDSVAVYLNGNLLLANTVGFGTLTSFSAAAGSGDFVSGLNTLTFVVLNNPNTPTGLLVSSLSGTAVVPVPASFLLMGFGSVSAFGLSRFRRLRAAV